MDLSSIQLDDTHIHAKRGGKSEAYQGRKKSKTTNTLIITDSQGIPLAGNHNDAFNLVKTLSKMTHSIQWQISLLIVCS